MLALGLLGAVPAGCAAAPPAGSSPSAGGPVSPSCGLRAGQAASPARSAGTPRSGGHTQYGLMGWQRFCAAPAGASMRAALQRPVPASLSDEVVPLGLSGDGRTAYVSTWAPEFAGVAGLMFMAMGCGHPASREECQEIFDTAPRSSFFRRT